VKKWPFNGLSVPVQRTGPAASILFGILSLPFSTELSMLFAGLFIGILFAYMASSNRGKFRIGYLELRESYWGLTFLAGFVMGVVLQLRQLLGLERQNDQPRGT
jgi:uncharacterized integral membrane protein